MAMSTHRCLGAPLFDPGVLAIGKAGCDVEDSHHADALEQVASELLG